MKKLLLIAVFVFTLFMSGCSTDKVLPVPANTEEKFVTEGVTNFSGEIISINDNMIELEDGTVINITNNLLITGHFITLIIEEGPTNYEFYVKQVVSQSTALINSPINILDVVLEDGTAEVSGIFSVIEGNVTQIKDKRFILTEDTVFPESYEYEEYVILQLKEELTVGNLYLDTVIRMRTI